MNSGDGRSTVPLVGQYKEPPAQPGSPPQKPQQPHVGTVVRWERFLPLRSLKVLLVENDDSTRQVVSALLRNCSYEVSAVANGLEAWKVLGDLTNHVDLILTEVVMPCLSGIGLLMKIMSHKTHKNIPVIMMSSHDSMGVVFKCLSKGAVDFLVKPIRKNELKNLWQHIWRRCHSSSGSGSGSESGTQTQKSIKPKSMDESDENNIGSNDKDDDTSSGLNMRDGSDNGSGTQSSWTKRMAEVESPQPMSPMEQFRDRQDSTCAQVIHPKTETICNDWIPLSRRKDNPDKELPDAKGKKLKIATLNIPYAHHEPHSSQIVTLNIYGPQNEVPLGNNSMKNECRLEGDNWESSNMKEFSGQNDEAVNPSGDMANSSRLHASSRTIMPPDDTVKISEQNKAIVDVEEPPYLELSLKRASRDCGTVTKDEHNVLRHSDLSAFSRYNTSAGSNQVPVGCSSFLLDNSSEVKIESLHNPLSISSAVPLNQGSNGSTRNNMQSATKIVFAKPNFFTEKVTAASLTKDDHTSAFHSVHQQSCKAQDTKSETIGDLEASETVVQLSRTQHHVQVQHHHHHHFHHHHVHTMQPQQHQSQHPQDHDELALTIAASDAPQCGSSNVFTRAVECNVANCSINGSVSGSHHGSNAPNGSCAAANTGAINLESDSGGAGKSGGYGSNGSRSGSGSGADQNRFTQREAALNKFRQKRKERCFEKKVRYQSRKRLAEQRPRVRGQFVRQPVHELDNPDANC